ncbi:alpha/beta hydrolase family protein [Streptomyces sp. NPDC001922]|uniref:alpha/beta hydrolase family protein n=1 Tax=Streptomyces sp. NPDC001922 TaxID=3364624 RepID=UPI0036A8CC8D
MGLRTAAAGAALTVLGAGAAAVAAGRYASDAALKPHRLRPLPADPPLTVHGVADGRIALTRSLTALRPGTYGLTGGGTHAVVGPVLKGVPHAPDVVVRRLERVTHGSPGPGARLWLTPQVHIGNPRDALGLDHADVDVPGDRGPLPAWFVPGARDTWVITVHGLGTGREHPMVVMPFLHRHRFPVLDLGHRGDLGAPRPPDGIQHFGATEWRDLDAGMSYAARYGAEHIVLYGWSTGATMALIAAAHSPLRHLLSGLVLDSPVLDWRATVGALASAAGAPRPLLPLAVRAAQGRLGLDGDLLGGSADPERLSVPALLLHGPDDTIAPWETSRALAERRPDLVTLHTVPHAPHAAMWNADPQGYEEALRRFLTPLM